MDGFDSAWLKWAQAVVNADVLQDNINELHNAGQVQIQMGMTQEYDARRHCVIITAGPEVPRVFPVHWGLLLGDIVHNYRCSLDHLAWSLYKRGRTPNLTARQEQSVQFPIARDRQQFNRLVASRLPRVRRADIASVRRYQPYLGRRRLIDQHVFAVLQDLSNADKHRVIQLGYWCS
jgi:hypothetical protein